MHNNAADTRYKLIQVSTFLLQTLAEMVEGHSVDPVQLYQGLGFTIEDLWDPTQRISYHQAVSMIQHALRVLLERELGLRVEYQSVLNTPSLLGHVLSLCRTLCDVFDIGVRYQRGSDGIVTSSVYQQGETFFAEVERHLPNSGVQMFATERFFANLLVYERALVSPAFELLGIELIHVTLFYAGKYLHLLGPRVCFDCLHNRMAIASHWLDMRLSNHSLPTLRQALTLLEQESTQMHWKLDLVQVVERAIAHDLSLGSQVERISAGLNMNSRILRRRLAEHELTFEALLKQVR